MQVNIHVLSILFTPLHQHQVLRKLQYMMTLADMNMYGAILGRALYEGRVDLCEALQEVKKSRKER